MRQMKSYKCFLTEKGDVVVVVPFIGMSAPKKTYLLYAGGEHALFYKTPDEAVILDYLNEVVRPILKQTARVLLFEVDMAVQAIIRDYFVPVEHVEKLPEFELELEVA